MPEFTTWLTRECYGVEVSFAVTAIIDVSAAYPGSPSAPAEPATAEVSAVEITVTEDERATILEAWEDHRAKHTAPEGQNGGNDA